MLKQLTLNNFLLIDALDIEFDAGLTTITGESGAGKSILLNALALVLGERARTEAVRPGAARADIAAEFILTDLPRVQERLTADELSSGDGHCLIRRVVSSNGRSRAFVNGVPVTTQYLRSLGEQLVDIHGQNEHQSLADHNTQLKLLDDFAGISARVDQVVQLYREWQASLGRIQTLQEHLTAAADRKDLLTYQLDELQQVNLQTDEFQHLAEEHKRLNQARHIQELLHQTLQNLDEMDALRQSVRVLEGIDDNSSELNSARAALQTVLNLLDDGVRDLRRYQDHVVVDPEALSLLETRLNIVQDLARKHRINPENLGEHTENLRAELNDLDADRTALDGLSNLAEEQQQAFHESAVSLSAKRREAAPRFARAVSRYMQSLGINKGRFDVSFTEHISETGLERVEFHVTTNPTFPAGPLMQIASGGERTRISLSIQIVAAENSALPCLILDEADVGVGGTTADTVGRILRDLGRHTQVICITHAPQVAALGHHHFSVVKQGDTTNIQVLVNELRIEELARMLAGADITQKARDYARALLQEAGS